MGLWPGLITSGLMSTIPPFGDCIYPIIQPSGPLLVTSGLLFSRLFCLPVPQDLREWLDSAEKGFIFMSFGSIVRGSNIDEAKRAAILESFAALGSGVRVLWKVEAGAVHPDQVPANVRTEAWLPQNDILGEPAPCALRPVSGAGEAGLCLCLSLTEAIAMS